MAATRRITAELHRVEAVRSADRCGVVLTFLPTSRGARDIDRIDVFAALGPGLTLASADGVGTMLRVARAARVSAPKAPEAWIDRPDRAAERLAPAVDRAFALDVVRRLRLRFVAWCEDDTIEIERVLDVREDEDAFHIRCVGAHVPIRIPRANVVRHETVREIWYQVTWIERA